MSPQGPNRFKVIDGGGKPLAGTRRRHKKDAVLVRCRVCEADTGVATATWIKGKQGLMERAGRPEGGTTCYICVGCLARGKVTTQF